MCKYEWSISLLQTGRNAIGMPTREMTEAGPAKKEDRDDERRDDNKRLSLVSGG